MEKQIIYKQQRINYRVEGAGTAIMLVHGFPEDNRIFEAQVNYLKNKYFVVVPDLPGSGKSEFYEKEGADATIEDYTAFLYAILEEEQITQCIMCGYSMGGYITLAFAEKHPHMLKAFGLIHSTAFADSEEKKANRKRSIQTMQQYGAAAFLKTIVPGLFAPQFKNTHTGEINALIERGNNFTVKALQQYYTAMMNRPDRTSVLAGSEVPVLFIIGTEDTAAPLKDVMKQVPLVNVSHFHILENVGHMSMLEAPDALNKHLVNFIEAV